MFMKKKFILGVLYFSAATALGQTTPALGIPDWLHSAAGPIVGFVRMDAGSTISNASAGSPLEVPRIVGSLNAYDGLDGWSDSARGESYDLSGDGNPSEVAYP